ncbi:hypothetical protein T439DRAFT_382824 [Meredithblackwellia eburnea MCA 4105]
MTTLLHQGSSNNSSYFQYQQSASQSSGLLQVTPTGHPLFATSSGPSLDSRGPSFDLSLSQTTSNTSSTSKDPFRDPSFELSYPRAAIQQQPRPPTSLPGVAPSHSLEIPDFERPSFDSGNSPFDERPEIKKRPSEVNRELKSAMEDEWDSSSFVSDNQADSHEQRITGESRKEKRKSSGSAGDGGLLSQFRTGSGWFAPLVPPVQPPTRAEREQQNSNRIRDIKEGKRKSTPSSSPSTETNSGRRPGLLKRLSSGVEMRGWGGK